MTARLKPRFAADMFFFLSLGLFLSVSILSTSLFYSLFVGKLYTLMQVLCLVLLVIHEFYNGGLHRQHWRSLAVSLILFMLLLRVTNNSNEQRLVTLMLPFVYCARRIPFEKIARFALNVSIVVVCVIVYSGYLGIIDNVVVAKGTRIREYLGFRYALYLPGILLNMTALWIYLHRKDLPLPTALLWVVLNWFVYEKTNSRISFALAVVLIVAAIAMRFGRKYLPKLDPLWATMVWSFPIFGGFSLIMTALYNGNIPWMRKLNSFLESRLRLGKASLDAYGFKFFGQEMEWEGNGLDAFGAVSSEAYNYVDCLYVKMLQRYGVLVTIVLAVLFTWAMYRLWKRRHYHILLISASVMAHCVLDDLSFTLHYNTFWLALGVVLINPVVLGRKRKKKPISPEQASPEIPPETPPEALTE